MHKFKCVEQVHSTLVHIRKMQVQNLHRKSTPPPLWLNKKVMKKHQILFCVMTTNRDPGKEFFCLTMLAMYDRISPPFWDPVHGWQTGSSVPMETVRHADRVSVGKRAGFTESWSISPINNYCSTSQHAQLTAPLTVAVVQILLTLYVDRLSEPLRSDLNHILRLFFLTRIQHRYQARSFVLWKFKQQHKFCCSFYLFIFLVCVCVCVCISFSCRVQFLTIMRNDFNISVITRYWFDTPLPTDPDVHSVIILPEAVVCFGISMFYNSTSCE